MRKQVTKCAGVGAISVAVLIGIAPAAHAAPYSYVQLIPGTPYGQDTAEWRTPLVVPHGVTQTLIVDETILDIYPEQDDLTDMNTVNETGAQAGRYLYRTHEVGENGSVSVIDLQTREAKVLVQDPGFNRLDGLRWTPWGTLLFAEETAGGRLFEAFLDPGDPTVVVKVVERTEAGVMRHEGIEALSDGTVFVIDELNGGSIYKFVPTTPSDLSDGQLYALKLTGIADEQQLWNETTFTEKVGPFEWVPLDMSQVVVDTDAASNAVHATEFGRPEDIEVIGSILYVANTTEDRVVAIDLNDQVLTPWVQAGLNAPVEDADAGVTGFSNPDNLATGPGGTLLIVEDNYLSDIWASGLDRDGDGTADHVALLASLKDPGAEVSGIYYTERHPKTLFFNIQHPEKPLADGTWRLTLDYKF